MSSRAWVAGAFLLAAISASVAPDMRAGEADVVAIAHKHCVTCHAQKPSHPSFGDLKAWAPKILEQVVWDRNMPVGNESGMTEEERALLARWIQTLK